MRKLTTRQFATIKRVAQNVNPLVARKNKIIEQMKALDYELQVLHNEITGHEAGILSLTGGYVSEDLVQRVVETVEKDGKTYKTTKYVPTDKVIHSEEENCYYIKDETPEITENTLPEPPAEINIEL